VFICDKHYGVSTSWHNVTCISYLCVISEGVTVFQMYPRGRLRWFHFLQIRSYIGDAILNQIGTKPCMTLFPMLNHRIIPYLCGCQRHEKVWLRPPTNLCPVFAYCRTIAARLRFMAALTYRSAVTCRCGPLASLRDAPAVR